MTVWTCSRRKLPVTRRGNVLYVKVRHSSFVVVAGAIYGHAILVKAKVVTLSIHVLGEYIQDSVKPEEDLDVVFDVCGLCMNIESMCFVIRDFNARRFDIQFSIVNYEKRHPN